MAGTGSFLVSTALSMRALSTVWMAIRQRQGYAGRVLASFSFFSHEVYTRGKAARAVPKMGVSRFVSFSFVPTYPESKVETSRTEQGLFSTSKTKRHGRDTETFRVYIPQNCSRRKTMIFTNVTNHGCLLAGWRGLAVQINKKGTNNTRYTREMHIQLLIRHESSWNTPSASVIVMVAQTLEVSTGIINRRTDGFSVSAEMRGQRSSG